MQLNRLDDEKKGKVFNKIFFALTIFLSPFFLVD